MGIFTPQKLETAHGPLSLDSVAGFCRRFYRQRARPPWKYANTARLHVFASEYLHTVRVVSSLATDPANNATEPKQNPATEPATEPSDRTQQNPHRRRDATAQVRRVHLWAHRASRQASLPRLPMPSLPRPRLPAPHLPARCLAMPPSFHRTSYPRTLSVPPR